jgi:hypothetical protein
MFMKHLPGRRQRPTVKPVVCNFPATAAILDPLAHARTILAVNDADLELRDCRAIRSDSARCAGSRLADAFRRMVVRPPKSKQKHYPELILTVIQCHRNKCFKGSRENRMETAHLSTGALLPGCNREVGMVCTAMEDRDLSTKILKSGCRAEEPKLRTAGRLVNLIAIL